MKVHHAQVKKAEKIGCTIETDGEWYTITWPKRNVRYQGASGADAIGQMEAIQQIYEGDEYVVAPSGAPRTVLLYRDNDRNTPSIPYVPVDALEAVLNSGVQWEYPLGDGVPDAPAAPATDQQSAPAAATEPTKVERSPKGVALDGAVAYKEGTPSGDNPYLAEDMGEEEGDAHQLAEEWDAAWDAAADENAESEDKGGSVVSEKYRAKYAEAGHPTHCGDWLAETLNSLCLTKEGTELDRFEAICAANGVNTAKYKRTGVGWQGRIRMTGRNLLAKAVFKAKGVLLTPIDGAEPSYQAPQSWLDQQRFK